MLPLMETCRIDRIGLAAQDWLVPAPEKIVVTSANQESEDGREEGSRMSEHLSAEEEKTRKCLTRIDENTEGGKKEKTGINICHTKHHPQLDPRPTIGSPHRAQRPQRPQNILTALQTAGSLNQPPNIRPRGLLNTTPPTDHQTDRRPADYLYTAGLFEQPYTNHQISDCQPDYLLAFSKIYQPRHLLAHVYQTRIYQPEHLLAHAYQTGINDQMSAYRLQMSAYRLDHIPRHTQLYCCNRKGQHLIQQLHGNYTDLKPNSFRSGDDWPD